MADLGYRDLSERIVAAALAVGTALGPGFLEKVHENALGVELTARGLRFDQQNQSASSITKSRSAGTAWIWSSKAFPSSSRRPGASWRTSFLQSPVRK
jgi:hypothetical protein